MSFDTLLAQFERKEMQDAESEGLSIEEYRERRRAESEAAEEAQRAKDECAKRARRLGAMSRHLSTAGYSAVVNNTLNETTTLTFVKRWLRSDERPPMAILTGNTGCGKTVAAAWGLCRTHGGEYVHARDLAARYMPYSHDQARGVEPMSMEAMMLVIDDMGTERRSSGGKEASDDRFTEAFSTVLETRQWSSRPTIITTNLTPEAFIERYCRDPRDKSRLLSMAVFCKGGRDDLRK